MYGCYSWGSWFFMSWFPVFLVRGCGFSEAEMGIYSSLPFLLGVVGNLTGGYVSDRLVTRYGLKFGRRSVACASLAASSLLVAALAFTRNKAAIVVLSSCGFGVMDLMLPVSWAVCLDIAPRHSGTVTGIMNSAGQLGGFLCTVLFGYLVQISGSYHSPLWVISGMLLFSAFLSRKSTQLANSKASRISPSHCAKKSLGPICPPSNQCQSVRAPIRHVARHNGAPGAIGASIVRA